MCRDNMPNERMPLNDLLDWIGPAVADFTNSSEGKVYLEYKRTSDCWQLD